MSVQDEVWMRRALQLAERGRGTVEPNPLVGAVLVREGQVVGEGWHEKFGHAHAEVNAIAHAGELARGATLYVTLEPCCHHGKTPPCTDAVLAAGITRVVTAMIDPFPRVAGGGAARLRQAGLSVETGVCEAEARRQNAPYLTLLSLGRPRVHAKWACTLDGKIATRSGESQWISNERSRAVVHRLRGQMDGILVGIGTALADNPRLTARPSGPRLATRVVLDHRARLPLTSALVQSARDIPVLVVTAASAPADRVVALRDQGCEVFAATLSELLTELGQRRWTNLLVEGGGEVLGSFLDANLVDEAHVFMAPKIFGGQEAPGPVAGEGVSRVSLAWTPSGTKVEILDGDVYVHAWR